MDEHGIWLTSDFSERHSRTVCFMTTIFFSELFLSAHWIGNGALLLDNIYTKFGTYNQGIWMIVCFMASWKISRPVVAFLCRLHLNKKTEPVIARRRISCQCRHIDAFRDGQNRDEIVESAEASGTLLQAATFTAGPLQSSVEVSSSTTPPRVEGSSPVDQAAQPERAQEPAEQRIDNGLVHDISELRYVPTNTFQVIATVASLLLGCCMVGAAFITHYTMQMVLYGVSTGILNAVISTSTRYHIKQFYRIYPYHIHRFTKQLARCTNLLVLPFAFPYLSMIDETYRSSMPFFLLATFAVALMVVQAFLWLCSREKHDGTLPNSSSAEEEMNQLISRYANCRESPNQPATFCRNLRELWSKFGNSFNNTVFVLLFFFSVVSSALIVEVFSLYLVSFPYLLYQRKVVMVDPLKESTFRSAYIILGWLPTVVVAYFGPHNSKRRGECMARLRSRNRRMGRLAAFVLGLILIAISLLKQKLSPFFVDPGYILFGVGSAAVFYLEKDVFSLIFKKNFNVIVPFIQIATGFLILVIHSTWLAVTVEYANGDFETTLKQTGHWILVGVALFWAVVLLLKTGKFCVRVWPEREPRNSFPVPDN